MNHTEEENTSAMLVLSKANHEIRNSLTLIRSTLQLIQSRHPEVLTFDHWEQVMEDIQGLDRILNDLSDFAHTAFPFRGLTDPLDGNETIQREYCDLYAITQTICRNFAVMGAQRGITIEVTAEPQAKQSAGSFFCDSSALKRVFINLLKNAIEAAEPRSTVRIHFSLTEIEPGENAPLLAIDVTNTGATIDPEQIDRIFELFFTTKEYGSGLGLPIVKQLIAQHKGTIQVSSENGLTSFHLQLPFE